jgi:hypothetical protein
MNHKELIIETLENLQDDFLEEGKVYISYIFLGRVSETINAGGYCSEIKSDNGDGGFYYNNETNDFFYYTFKHFGLGEEVFFLIKNKDLSLLPKPLQESLKRVAFTEKSETILFGHYPYWRKSSKV